MDAVTFARGQQIQQLRDQVVEHARKNGTLSALTTLTMRAQDLQLELQAVALLSDPQGVASPPPGTDAETLRVLQDTYRAIQHAQSQLETAVVWLGNALQLRQSAHRHVLRASLATQPPKPVEAPCEDCPPSPEPRE